MARCLVSGTVVVATGRRMGLTRRGQHEFPDRDRNSDRDRRISPITLTATRSAGPSPRRSRPGRARRGLPSWRRGRRPGSRLRADSSRLVSADPVRRKGPKRKRYMFLAAALMRRRTTDQCYIRRSLRDQLQCSTPLNRGYRAGNDGRGQRHNRQPSLVDHPPQHLKATAAPSQAP